MTVAQLPQQSAAGLPGGLSPAELTAQSLAATVDFKQLARPSSARTSGPQGSVEPFTIVNDPAAWKVADWDHNKDWVYRLSDSDLAELETAVNSALARGIPTEGNAFKVKEAVSSKADFLLPSLGPKLEAIRENVRQGRGFQLIKGVPVDRWTRKQVMVAYWGMGLYWGRAMSQNRKCHLIGHIKDIRGDVTNPLTRIYTTSLAQPFHSDVSDIVGLLCLKQATEGGLSSFSSSLSIVNEMLRQGRKDLVQELAGSQWWLDRKGEVPAGEEPYFRLPVLHYHNGFLSCVYSATYYELAQRHPQVPRLTEKQLEALRYFNALARSDELRMDMDLEPGDIQLLSNHSCLHSRSAFRDEGNWEDRRHLLRLWISPPHDRPLPHEFAALWGSTEPGNRGGLDGMGHLPVIPLEAE